MIDMDYKYIIQAFLFGFEFGVIGAECPHFSTALCSLSSGMNSRFICALSVVCALSQRYCNVGVLAGIWMDSNSFSKPVFF